MVQVINGSVLRGEGTAAFRKASGRACVIKNKSEIHTKKAIGDILVVSDLKEFSREDINDFVGIISAQSSLPNEKIIEDLDIPVVYGVLKAMELIKNGMFVTADSGKGIVSYSTSN
jgi:Phosphohistidine swiveling domain